MAKNDKPQELSNLVDVDHLSPPSETAKRQQKARPGPKSPLPHWFKPGQSGNPAGRPKGCRHKLATDFVQALADDFSKHGRGAITQVREEDPGKYLDIVAKLVPRDVDVNVNASDAFVRMWEAVASGTFSAMAEDLENVSRADERPN